MFTTEIRGPKDGLETSPYYTHYWFILIAKIRGPADGLETSPN